jgi:hypothetical protein
MSRVESEHSRKAPFEQLISGYLGTSIYMSPRMPRQSAIIFVTLDFGNHDCRDIRYCCTEVYTVVADRASVNTAQMDVAYFQVNIPSGSVQKNAELT